MCHSRSVACVVRTWPSDTGQCLNQSGTFDTKITAHGGLRHATVQRGNDGVTFLANDGSWSATDSTRPAGKIRAKTCHIAFLSESVAWKRGWLALIRSTVLLL
jgi:hypothetical protein